jgi:hypothetical protein
MSTLDERLQDLALAVKARFDTQQSEIAAIPTSTSLAGFLTDIKDHGAKCDGVVDGAGNLVSGTDDTIAVNAAIAAAAQLGGGQVFVPAHCVCSGPLTGSHNVTLFGPAGQGAGYSQPPPAQLIYTGTGATSFIQAGSTNAFVLRDLGIRYTSSSFTGDLIDFTHSGGADTAYASISRCLLAGINVHSAASLVNLGGAILSSIVDNHLQWGTIGVRGRKEISVGNVLYSNAHRIIGNTFDNLSTTAILNAGERWAINGNNFEGTNGGFGGMPRAYYDDISAASAATTLGLSYRDNWHGDAVAVTDAWFTNNNTKLRGFTMSGGQIEPNVGVPGVKLSGLVQGGSITGCYIQDHIDLGNVSHQGLSILGNFMTSDVVNLSTGAGNILIAGNTTAVGSAQTVFRFSDPTDIELGNGGGSGIFAVLKGLSQVNVSGSQVLSSRYAGTPAAATDLTSAITLANFLRDALLNHHGAIG